MHMPLLLLLLLGFLISFQQLPPIQALVCGKEGGGMGGGGEGGGGTGRSTFEELRHANLKRSSTRCNAPHPKQPVVLMQ